MFRFTFFSLRSVVRLHVFEMKLAPLHCYVNKTEVMKLLAVYPLLRGYGKSFDVLL